MIVAFTGPSKLTRRQELLVVKSMEDLLEPAYGDTWRSGCAFGVDTIAAHQAVLSGMLRVELYVPAAPHNERLVRELTDRVKITYCPNGPEPYRIRNEQMIGGVDRLPANLLIAFLKSDNFYRSGEWMTVNIADKLGVPVEQIILG